MPYPVVRLPFDFCTTHNRIIVDPFMCTTVLFSFFYFELRLVVLVLYVYILVTPLCISATFDISNIFSISYEYGTVLTFISVLWCILKNLGLRVSTYDWWWQPVPITSTRSVWPSSLSNDKCHLAIVAWNDHYWHLMTKQMNAINPQPRIIEISESSLSRKGGHLQTGGLEHSPDLTVEYVLEAILCKVPPG